MGPRLLEIPASVQTVTAIVFIKSGFNDNWDILHIDPGDKSTLVSGPVFGEYYKLQDQQQVVYLNLLEGQLETIHRDFPDAISS